MPPPWMPPITIAIPTKIQATSKASNSKRSIMKKAKIVSSWETAIE